jgi:hypothetical protein
MVLPRSLPRNIGPSFKTNILTRGKLLTEKSRFRSNFIEGTESFQDTNPTILASSKWTKSYDDGTKREWKYLPFDQIIIINNQANDIIFYRNQETRDGKIITGNTIKVINKPLYGWSIENVGSTTISAYANGTGITVEASKERLGADKKALLEGQEIQKVSTFANIISRFI